VSSLSAYSERPLIITAARKTILADPAMPEVSITVPQYFVLFLFDISLICSFNLGKKEQMMSYYKLVANVSL
jgi:hypothetical protein